MVLAKNSTRILCRSGHWLGAVLMAGALCLAASARAELPATQYYGSVEYVTGGFGIDESTAMKAAMPDYPLTFTFAASDGNRSAYVSKVQVVIRDHYDTTILNVESQGPFLLARLAPGIYQVHVTYQNQTQSRPVTVTDAKSARMVFEWKREATDPARQGTAPTLDTQPDTQREFAPGSIPGLD